MGVASLSFSPDGQLLVAGRQTGEAHMRAWRVSQKGLTELTLPFTRARRLAIAPDGKTLAFLDGYNGLHLMDLSSAMPMERAVLSGGDGPGSGRIQSFAFAPDGGRLASVNTRGHVVIWNVAEATKVQDCYLPRSLEAVAFAQDGRHLAVGSGDGMIYILRLGTQPLLR
ncbi:MAG TPA: hypothetical protein VGY58_04505, partial [Gemmataceae bacterium]|jgi:WD40 repeat protein|nr:hypothetical protein [Gemmataceae bacterium]